MATVSERDKEFAAFCNIYEEVFELDYSSLVASEITRTETSTDIIPEKINLMDGYEAITREIVHPDDVESYKSVFHPDSVKKLFENTSRATAGVTIRMKQSDGEYHWHRSELVRKHSLKDDMVFLACTSDVDAIVRKKELEIQARKDRDRAEMLSRTINMIPTGAAVVTYRGDIATVNVNKPAADMLGLDKSSDSDEISEIILGLMDRYLEKVSRITHPEKDKVSPCHFDITRKDGSVLWIKAAAAIEHVSLDETRYYCSLYDVTHHVDVEEQLKKQNAMYKMVLEQTQEIVFEHDLVNDRFIFSNTSHLSDDIPSIINSPLSHGALHSVFDRRDLERVSEWFEQATKTVGRRTIEYRARLQGNRFSWYSCTAESLEGPDGSITRIVGFIREITELYNLKAELKREKESAESRVTAAQIDAVTGLLGRAALRKKIDLLLQSEDFPGGGFIIFDVDNFKMINDTAGHPVGDRFLSELGAQLRKVTREDDVVGRLGGDEFMALLPGMITERDITNKVREIMSVVEHLKYDMTLDDSVGVSVGMAVVPAGGAPLEKLYQDTDKALYKAKRDGKNRFVFVG